MPLVTPVTEDLEDPIAGVRRPGGPDPRQTEFQRVEVVERESHSTLPTDVVLYLSGLDDDEKKLARIARRLARSYEVPPLYLFGTNDPSKYRDPFTGDPLSLQQANRFTNSFAPVAVASILKQMLTEDQANRLAIAQDPHRFPDGPDDPIKINQVAKLAKVLAKEMGDELPFDRGIALAAKLSSDGVSPRVLAQNLNVVRTWADAFGGISQDQIFGYAINLAMIGRKVTSVADLKVALFGADAVEQHAAVEAYREGQEENPTQALRPSDIEGAENLDLTRARLAEPDLSPTYWAEVEKIQSQIQMEQEAFQNSLLGQAIGGVGAALEHSWNFTQKGLVTVGSGLQGAGVVLLQGSGIYGDPQGDSLEENLRLIQRNHAWAWQRIEAGDTVGDFVQRGYGAPEWTAPAFDFLVGWYVDPLVVAGKVAAVGRSARMLPGTLDKITLPGLLASKVPGVRKIWEIELAQRALRTEAKWAQAVPDFASSGISRRLFADAYKGTTGFFRRIERLRGVYEARGTLDMAYMKALRDKITQAFPSGGDDAWRAWQDGMIAHFTGKAPAGSIADEVVQARAALGFRADGIARDFVHQPKLFEETTSGMYVPNKDGYVQLSDDVIDGANVRGRLAPGELSVELPGNSFLAEWGPRRIGRTVTTSPAFTKTALGRRSARLINYNPGRVLSMHDAPEQYVLLHARRWAQFDEKAVRRFESEALEIVNSGKGVEAKLDALIKKIDRQGFDAMVAPYHLTDDLQDQVFRDIYEDTYKLNSREQVFGVTRRGAADAPLLESQLSNIAYIVDPIAARQYVRRLISMRTRGSQYLRDALGHAKTVGAADIAPDILQRVSSRMANGIQDWHRAYIKFWKAFTVARPAYVVRVIGIDENARFLATAGSLTERIMSLSLARQGAGKSNFLARALDDVFSDVIKVGDDTITIPRAGAYEYEAAAAGRVRESEVLEDVLRQATIYDKAMKANGGWEVLDAATNEALHRAAWGHALRKQLRQSAPGRVGLESVQAGDTIEATERALLRWAKEDGYVTLTSRIGIDPVDADLWASDLASLVHAYTLGNRDLATLALTGSNHSLDHALRGVKVDNRPRVHGPSVEQITDGGLLTRTTNRLYETFVRLPEDALNRQPFYSVWKRRYEKSAYEALASEGVTGITPAMQAAISNAGRRFALGQVRRVMFDFTKQSRFTELLQWFFPFPQPFFEGFQAWGHIAWRNPEVIGRAMALWRLGEESGFLRKDPVSGEMMIPLGAYKRPALLVNTLLGGDSELLKKFDMIAPIAGLNMLTSTSITAPADGVIGRLIGGVPIPVPGLDVMVAAGLQKAFATTRSRWLSGWLFQYGPTSPIRMIPSQLQAPLRALAPNLFEDESARKSMMLTVAEAIRQMGLDVDDEGKALSPEDLNELAGKMTDDLMAVRAFTGLLTPTSPRFVLENAQADRELFDSYMEDANQDYFAATEAFLKDHPDKYPTVASRTVMQGYSEDQNAPRINPSDLVHELYRAPNIGDFMKANPQWAALMLIGTDPALAEEFNFSQFSEMIASGVMRYKTPAEYLSDAQAVPAYRELDQFYKEIWNPGLQALTDGGLDEQDDAYKLLKSERSKFYQELAAKYPQWGRLNVTAETSPDGTTEYVRTWGGNPEHVPVDQLREDAWQIANTPGIETMPGPQALRTYLEGTEEIKQEMARLRLTDITSERAKEAGLWDAYTKVVADTVEQAPDIEPFLRNYFGVGSDDGVVTYTEDLVYRIGETDMEFLGLDPETQDRVANLDTRIEELREATRSGFDNNAERSEAYLQASRYLDKMLTDNPKLVKKWWQGQGAYYREQYKEGLVSKPVTFYSRFDFDQMGVKLTKRAAGWLDTIAQARVDIAKREEADPVGYSESSGYEAIDAWVKAKIGKDPSFDEAVKAMNTWGWSLERSGYTKIEGKAGKAWDAFISVARSVQQQIDARKLGGQDFGTDDERRIYDQAQKALLNYANELRDWSKAFDHSWNELQELTGEAIVGGAGLFMPDSYFGPMGRVD